MSTTSMRPTWEKVLEYASSPLQGTLSRKQRKGVSLQINEGKVYTGSVIFIGPEFIRITEATEGKSINTYYDWDHIVSIRTESASDSV